MPCHATLGKPEKSQHRLSYDVARFRGARHMTTIEPERKAEGLNRILEDLTTPPTLDDLIGLSPAQRSVAPGRAMLPEGGPALARVEAGIGMRYLLLEDGRRQVEALLYPGDLCGLTERLAQSRGTYHEAITPMVLSVIDPADLRLHTRRGGAIAETLLRLMAVEVSRLSQWLGSTGQRSAPEGIAWFVCQVWDRADNAGLIEADSAPFPFSQQVVADALGLSLVHTNKTMRRLREQGLFRIADGRVHVPALVRLRRAAVL